jgi:hypothetical protein
MNENSSSARTNLLIALAFAVAAFALRAPLRSEYGYYWDSVQFALAVEHFDMRAGLPHPPGFFLYVMLGRLVNVFVGDPLRALVWINVVTGAVLVGVTFLLAHALFGRRCGWLTGVIMATSPLTWFYSEFALTTIPDALLVVTMALVCWRVWRTGGTWGEVIGLSVLLAVMGGIRGQTVPGMLPLWLATFWRMRERRWAKLAAGLILAAGLMLAWLIPMLAMTGGWGTFIELVRTKSRFDAPLRLVGGGLPALMENIAIVTGTMMLGLLAAGVVPISQFWIFVRRTAVEQRATAYEANVSQLSLLAWWIVPQLLFGTAIMYTFAPGYVLSYFPAVAVLAGFGVAEFCGRTGVRSWLAGALIVAVNGWFFLCEPAMARSLPRLTMSAAELRRQDRQLEAWTRTIRKRYRPDEVMIWHSGQWYLWGIRHFQYFLPEYENWLLTHDPALAAPRDRQYWRVQNRKVEFVGQLPQVGVKRVLLIVPPGGKLETFRPFYNRGAVMEVEVPGGVPLYELRPEG